MWKLKVNIFIFWENIFISYMNIFIYLCIRCLCSQMDPLELLRRMNVEIFSYFVKGGIRPVRPMNIWKSLHMNQNLVCQYKSRCALHDENTDCRNYKTKFDIWWKCPHPRFHSQIQIFFFKRVQIGRTWSCWRRWQVMIGNAMEFRSIIIIVALLAVEAIVAGGET